ncbi:TPA: hypothetical protein N2G31_004276 [Salmonella enterica]|nr:hypothetical protein [Salmonella enterica]
MYLQGEVISQNDQQALYWYARVAQTELSQRLTLIRGYRDNGILFWMAQHL